MQNYEPQRPPVGRPSLLSDGPAQEESSSILSQLDGAGRKGAAPGAPARRARKGLVAGTVFALAAVGGVVALVVQDVNSITQVPPMAAAQQAAAPFAGLAQDAVPAPIAEPADAPSGGSAAAVIQDTPAVVPAAPVAGSVADSGGAAAGSAAALRAAAPVTTSSGTSTALATPSAALPAAGAVVAAPALALASALAAPSPDKASSAATIVDTAPAPVEQKAVRKVSQKAVQKPSGKARKAAAKEKERAVRLAKARGAAVAREKTAKKATQPKPAAQDNDVELLAALVAHTRPQQPARAARCSSADDKASAACAVEKN